MRLPESSPQSKQCAHAPHGGNAKYGDESKVDQMLHSGSFAPGLEHGDDSDEKQDDGDRSQNFHQHKRIPQELPGGIMLMVASPSQYRSDSGHDWSTTRCGFRRGRLIARTTQHGQPRIFGKVGIGRRKLTHIEEGAAIGFDLPHMNTLPTEPDLQGVILAPFRLATLAHIYRIARDGSWGCDRGYNFRADGMRQSF
jgi:hypothetical protein